MNLRPEEISTLIKDQIKNYRTKIEPAETGTVILFGDGIAKAHGLRSCVSNELLEFDDGTLKKKLFQSPCFPMNPTFTRAPKSAAREG